MFFNLDLNLNKNNTDGQREWNLMNKFDTKKNWIQKFNVNPFG